MMAALARSAPFRLAAVLEGSVWSRKKGFNGT